jgi:antitoxin CptB
MVQAYQASAYNVSPRSNRLAVGVQVMSTAQAKNLNFSAKQRRILFRSWHRGIREMDLILGRFSDAEIGNLCESELDEFERLLEVPDHDLFSWITGEATLPAAYETSVLRKIRNFHNHAAPIHT